MATIGKPEAFRTSGGTAAIHTSTMAETSINSFCPHCKQPGHLRLLLTHPYDEERRSTWDRDLANAFLLKAYFAFACTICEEVILYHCNMYHHVGQVLEEIFDEDVQEALRQVEPHLSLPDVVWPPTKSIGLSNEVPNSIRRIYAEALEVKATPELFAVQIRRGLEAICIDQGELGDKLDTDLKNLSSAGILPPIIAEIAKELKLIGNAGAHIKPRQQRDIAGEVEAIDDFFRIVLNYVYELPEKLRSYQERLAPRQAEIDAEGSIN